MKQFISPLIIVIGALSIAGCNQNSPSSSLFKSVSSDHSGVTFSNDIQERDTFNILTHEYIYNGGGVGIADFNNDGLQDLFFAGNIVPNQLYINQGKLKFRNVTEEAHVNEKGRWNSGVAVVDINNDGLMDIYVCATMKPDSADRRNMLFINKGINADGVPVFEDQAKQYGLDDSGFSVTAAFLDYDRDGDLDVYVLTNQRLDNFPTNYRPKMVHGESPNNDKLFRNNGNGTFTNVSKEAGILVEGFGLGLSIADFNNDGWPDIYVSNDYLSNDLLYINQRNGTFENKIANFIGHQSQFSMGNDAADINNDGLDEIITLDMLPESNDRKKTTISNKSYLTYINNEKFSYEYQYVRNMLHLNNGLDHHIKFSEIGQLSGVYQTEWSWSPLFADFDNDGNKDLMITNGFPKDVTDKDFGNYRSDVGAVANVALLIDSIPVVKIPNYAFRNKGNLQFEDVTQKWGLDKPSFSNGAAFVDLDNDGDLDYVVNNINDPAFIYENQLNDKSKADSLKKHFLRVKLKGKKDNVDGVGARVSIVDGNGNKQYFDLNIYRGFLSSVEGIAHFGLNKESKVDSLFVQWPDGNVQLETNVQCDQLLTVKYDDGHFIKLKSGIDHETLLKESSRISYKHEEPDVIDFNLQRTLPHKFSQQGPGIAAGDLNGDGLEDIIIGGSSRESMSVFLQKKDGSFGPAIKGDRKSEEDESLLLFDADGDKDLDLYVVSGSIEALDSLSYYQDRLFINNGKGKLSLEKNRLPEISASGSCVRAADYDSDGDLDLFVGGRVIPGKYPFAAESYILKNDKGVFTNATETDAVELKNIGMVTDAIWSDYNGDGKVDLIVVGEFMPVTIFKNNQGKLVQEKDTGITSNLGWWNSIAGGDFDSDGDIDYVVGNLGLNNNYQVTKDLPLKVFAKDFDGNGSIDPVMACYIRSSMKTSEKKLYPMHFWDELNSQSPKFRNKFSRYRQYSVVPVEQLLVKDEMEGALILEANTMSSVYLVNDGKGKFTIKTLPVEVQVAPVNGIVVDDVNNDGSLDVLMVGNDYGNEVFAGRYDAFTGLLLLGDGKGNFKVSPSSKSGFYVPGNAKALIKVNVAGSLGYMATQNRDSVKFFERESSSKETIFHPDPLDEWAWLIFNDGTKQKVEFYYGSGYLSASTRDIKIPVSVKEIEVHDSQGKFRSILFPRRI
jgi:hypothetical protein